MTGGLASIQKEALKVAIKGARTSAPLVRSCVGNFHLSGGQRILSSAGKHARDLYKIYTVGGAIISTEGQALGVFEAVRENPNKGAENVPNAGGAAGSPSENPGLEKGHSFSHSDPNNRKKAAGE